MKDASQMDSKIQIRTTRHAKQGNDQRGNRRAR